MDDTRIEMDLLALIYETVHDPGFWSLALEGLKHELETFSQEQNLLNEQSSLDDGEWLNYSATSKPAIFSPQQENSFLHATTQSTSMLTVSGAEKQLILRLTPHFHNALALNRQYVKLKEAKEVATTLLDQIPMGIIFVDPEGKIILSNKVAQGILDEADALVNNSGFIQTIHPKYNEELLSHIFHVAQVDNIDELSELPVITLERINQQQPISLLITPFKDSNSFATTSHNVALFIASADSNFALSTQALVALFDLTKAEARLAKYLASGVSLDQFATRFYLSKHTLRS